MAGDVIWGERSVGSPVAVGENEHGGHVIISDTPDWIRLPPTLGGTDHRVANTYSRPCPCGEAHEAKTFDLTGTDVHVSECIDRGFLWWR